MTIAIQEGDLLWHPSEEIKQHSNTAEYLRWLESEQQVTLHTPNEIWEWSITHLEECWQSIWEFFQVQTATPPTAILRERTMPGAEQAINRDAMSNPDAIAFFYRLRGFASRRRTRVKT